MYPLIFQSSAARAQGGDTTIVQAPPKNHQTLNIHAIFRASAMTVFTSHPEW